ncbi:mevalonate kinase [Neptuniibacter sp. CAU 1671]|uniref:mevalonate kinase family protein n=1 Tax=Neptuniibacter sp. CAU 1671 TaxID=3032593 RepID=UPI0023DA6B49|nr:mevalonate kinase [Neptuniibacter sp. CAU 1671]MDF2182116.1 mevalonate kinase [Neptuniibacter sp. CAU 1671]
MKAQAPGKLILSGEHSVVYGAPALAIAVREKVEVTLEPLSEGASITLSSDSFDETECALSDLPVLQTQLDKAYEAFLAGERSINGLLACPTDLLFYVLSLFPAQPGRYHIHSTIPAGSGLGSSAAVIAALLQTTAAAEQSATEFMQLVRFCERLQHGRGSLLDAAACTLGGVVRVQNDQVSKVELAMDGGWYRINTGRPDCSTGEVVEYVRQCHGKSSIWTEFSDLTGQLEQHWSDVSQRSELLRINHRLLQKIGVVPAEVSALVAKIEARGGAAKISGAGAHRGEHAGQLLVYWPEEETENSLAALSGLQPVRLVLSRLGACHEGN